MPSINRYFCINLLLQSALVMFSCGSDDPIIDNPDPMPSQPLENHFLNLSVADSLKWVMRLFYYMPFIIDKIDWAD